MSNVIEMNTDKILSPEELFGKFQRRAAAREFRDVVIVAVSDNGDETVTYKIAASGDTMNKDLYWYLSAAANAVMYD